MLLWGAALALAAPQPGELRTFRDWIVGCDNGRVCQAVALFPEPSLAGASLAVKRGPEPAAVPEIWLTTRGEDGAELKPAALSIDGQVFALTTDANGSSAPRDPAGVAARLGQASRIALLDASSKEIARVSTGGSAAALLYMDEQQRRTGTVTGLVRVGPKPAASVPPSPPLPRVVEVRATDSGAKPARLSPELARRLRARAKCDSKMAASDFAPEVRLIGPGTSVALLPCWLAAYNGGSLVLIARKHDGSDFRPAQFDYNASNGEQTGVTVPPDGAYWNEEKKRLASGFKGRGLGDCGSFQEWAWDGSRFRLVHEEIMGECRGSTDYITTWRAEVR